MNTKIEILKYVGSSIIHEEYVNCNYSINGDYFIISVRNEDDKSVVFHPYNLNNIKSYKIIF